MYKANENVENLIRVSDIEADRIGFYRMDKNERAISFSDDFIDKLKNGLTSETLTNYPNLDSFYNKLSSFLGIDVDCIFAHTGSDLAIKSIFETFVCDKTKILLHMPSYGMDEVYAKMFQATVFKQGYEDDLSFNLNDYISKIGKIEPDLVFLENPNGCIGNYYKKEDVVKVIDAANKCNALMIVDEAYIDFADESVIDLIPEYNNLIVVRTMSKAWGIAGLRLGYVASQKHNIDEIKKVRPMHELTSFTTYVGEMLLDNLDVVKDYIEETARARDYFIKEMGLRGIRTSKCKTNFVTTELGTVINIDDFRAFLKDRKYLIRSPFREDSLKKWVRIGLLTVEQMKEFVRLLDEFISLQQEK